MDAAGLCLPDALYMVSVGKGMLQPGGMTGRRHAAKHVAVTEQPLSRHRHNHVVITPAASNVEPLTSVFLKRVKAPRARGLSPI
jgi:hypothetical protein